MIWIQKGFAVISDFVAGEVAGPFLHSFNSEKWAAEQTVKKSTELPEHCRLNIRIVEGELTFDDGQSCP